YRFEPVTRPRYRPNPYRVAFWRIFTTAKAWDSAPLRRATAPCWGTYEETSAGPCGGRRHARPRCPVRNRERAVSRQPQPERDRRAACGWRGHLRRLPGADPSPSQTQHQPLALQCEVVRTDHGRLHGAHADPRRRAGRRERRPRAEVERSL